MKSSRYLLLLLFVIMSQGAAAQFTIKNIGEDWSNTQLRDARIKVKPLEGNRYYSEAFARAERKRIFKERNYIEVHPTVSLALNQFRNNPNQQNTFNMRVWLFYRHIHTKNNFTLDSKFEGAYGFYINTEKWYRNEDWFRHNMDLSWRFANSWSYAGSTAINSQFTQAFDGNGTLVSTVLAPLYFTISPGIIYQKAGKPLKIVFSPAAGQWTLIFNKKVASLGWYGVPAGHVGYASLGGKIRFEYEKRFAKDRFRYWTDSELFFDWQLDRDPTFFWNNSLEMTVMKYLKMIFYVQATYNRTVPTKTKSKWLLNYSFTLGFDMHYKNK